MLFNYCSYSVHTAELLIPIGIRTKIAKEFKTHPVIAKSKKGKVYHVITFCWWRHRQKLWCHKLYFLIPLFSEGLEQPILLTSSKLQTTFKDSERLKVLEIIHKNAICNCISWYNRSNRNCWLRKTADIRVQKLRVRATWFIFLLNLLEVRYNCTKFHHCRICRTGRERSWSPPSMSSPQKAHLIRINGIILYFFYIFQFKFLIYVFFNAFSYVTTPF